MLAEAKERAINIAKQVLPRASLVPLAAAGSLAVDMITTPVVEAGGGDCLPPWSACPTSSKDGKGPELPPKSSDYKTAVISQLSKELSNAFLKEQKYTDRLSMANVQLKGMQIEIDSYRKVGAGSLLALTGLGLFLVRRMRPGQNTK